MGKRGGIECRAIGSPLRGSTVVGWGPGASFHYAPGYVGLPPWGWEGRSMPGIFIHDQNTLKTPKPALLHTVSLHRKTMEDTGIAWIFFVVCPAYKSLPTRHGDGLRMLCDGHGCWRRDSPCALKMTRRRRQVPSPKRFENPKTCTTSHHPNRP